MKIGIAMGLCAAFCLLLSVVPGKKKLKGTLHSDRGVFDQIEGETPCRLDSADGFVVEFQQEVENPLFESKAKNKVRLLLWFRGDPAPEKRYYVPSDDIKGLCYREQGDLLMFETFQGSGWIEFGAYSKKGRLEGTMDLKLVEPHHNFSNSDFHHMGGDFCLEKAKSDPGKI